jgi:hypothetical protein
MVREIKKDFFTKATILLKIFAGELIKKSYIFLQAITEMSHDSSIAKAFEEKE